LAHIGDILVASFEFPNSYLFGQWHKPFEARGTLKFGSCSALTQVVTADCWPLGHADFAALWLEYLTPFAVSKSGLLFF
jgi:hypothetical protein